MIHDPHAQTLTAIVGVSHPAFVLLDPGEQERRVATWGRVLATTCRSGRIARIQVCERTLPDGGSGLVEWWRRTAPTTGRGPRPSTAELIERAGPAGERHATTISLALDMKAAARQIRTNGGGIKGAAAVLRQEMTTLVDRAARRGAHRRRAGSPPARSPSSSAPPTTRPPPRSLNGTATSVGTSRRRARSRSPRRGIGCGQTPRTMRCCG